MGTNIGIRVAAIVAMIAIAALTACGPILADHTNEGGAAVVIDPWKELLVVDDAVMRDPATSNTGGSALGFRHTMERLAASEDDASDVTLGWLETWAAPAFTCAWLRARAENACDEGCGACGERRLDLARAPFRTIAVSNRIDLPEGRLLFAATDGPGDDPGSSPLPITVIAEFRLDGDPVDWAARWHALGAHATFDAGFVLALTDVTERFVRAGGLAQLRVDDASSGPTATLHEAHRDPTAVDGRARIISAKLRRTPAADRRDTPELAKFVLSHRDEILADRHEVPFEMLADRVALGETWRLPGVDEPLRRAFAASTCDGCHGGENPVLDAAFHVSPLRSGRAKVSRFLFDPDRPGEDELSRRADVLRRLIGVPVR